MFSCFLAPNSPCPVSLMLGSDESCGYRGLNHSWDSCLLLLLFFYLLNTVISHTLSTFASNLTRCLVSLSKVPANLGTA